MINYLIWLDDIRPVNFIFDTKQFEIVVIKNHDDFKQCLIQKGIPEFISFDHDLGETKTGYDCAVFLLEYCLIRNLELPEYNVHSANPVGRKNIIQLLSNFDHHKQIFNQERNEKDEIYYR